MDIVELVKQYREIEEKMQLLSLSIEDPIRGEAGVLFHLSKTQVGLSSGELCQLLRLSSGRVSIILKSLEHKNLITRSYEVEDKRFIRVTLTEQGKLLEKRNEAIRNEKVISIIEKLGEKDTVEYIRLRRKKMQILLDMTK